VFNMVSMETDDNIGVQQHEEEAGIVHTEPNTTLFYGDRDRGKGTLLITEHHIVWKGATNNREDVLNLQYPSISLHAISRDTSSFPHECLYVLLECAEAVSEDQRDPEADVCEIRFVPDAKDSIKFMYDAVTQCQELHPDPDEDDSEEEGEPDFDALLNGGEFYTAENMPDEIELSAEGQAVLQRLNISAQGNDGNGHSNGNGNGCTDQFEDADDDMGES